MDRQKLEVIIGHIDDVIGPPADETPEEHEARMRMIVRDAERRRLRKRLVGPNP